MCAVLLMFLCAVATMVGGGVLLFNFSSRNE